MHTCSSVLSCFIKRKIKNSDKYVEGENMLAFRRIALKFQISENWENATK